MIIIIIIKIERENFVQKIWNLATAQIILQGKALYRDITAGLGV